MRQLRQLVQRYADMAALHGSMYQYAVNCALVQSCTGIAAAQQGLLLPSTYELCWPGGPEALSACCQG